VSIIYLSVEKQSGVESNMATPGRPRKEDNELRRYWREEKKKLRKTQKAWPSDPIPQLNLLGP
jgi:hypothetical protein